MQKNYLTKLKQLENNNVLPHAILLSGEPEQTFKIAVDFTKWLFCEDHKAIDDNMPCKCKACIIFMANNHPDYLLINLEQEIKIDVIREVNNFANSRPYLANRKVVLINNMHNINKQAANAFLKTLEEPPFSTKILFLLLSSYPKILPITILSRVLQVNIFVTKTNDEDKREILQDLYNILVQDNINLRVIIEKWSKFDKQQLINCLWFIVTNILREEKDPMLLQIKQKISPNLLWQLLDSLNYMNRAIILGDPINWQLFLDNFVFTKFIGENVYGRSRGS